jgi:hypothetical protein
MRMARIQPNNASVWTHIHMQMKKVTETGTYKIILGAEINQSNYLVP